MIAVLQALIWIYIAVLFAHSVFSWIPSWKLKGPARTVQHICAALTEPVLAPMRRALPQPKVSGANIDISPTLLMVVLVAISSVL